VVYVSVQVLFTELCHFSSTNYCAVFIVDRLNVLSSPHMTLNVTKCPSFCSKNLNHYHKYKFTSTHFVSSLYETQNEYCQIYQQQLLYEKLIMHKNTDFINIYMYYL
jgi:hypothetical protein